MEKAKESAYKPGSVEGQSFIWDVRRRTPQATYPEAMRTTCAGQARCSPIWSCSRWGFPCRGRLPVARCALTAPFHPYLSPKAIGGMFSVALSVGSRPPGVTWHLVLWSPDFPLRGRSDRPADSSLHNTGGVIN